MFMMPRNGVGTPKQCGLAHETAIKRENDEFLVSPLNHVLTLTGPKNGVGTPKQCGIAHEAAITRENDEFLVSHLKPCTETHGA
jgi:hypothetical protein